MTTTEAAADVSSSTKSEETASTPLTFRQRAMLIVLALAAVGAVMRATLIPRTGIWADELFSLAMATGHSLEHAASVADPAQGDFVEHPDPVDPDAYRQYLRHDSPPASPARVVRAVFESDTSPPLYYLLLYGWTRAVGTSDWALRSFSLVAALACFPLIWSIARQLAGINGAIAACALYAFSPLGVYYATEGRMYSLLWLFTLCTMAATLRMWRRGSDFATLALWVLSAAAGLLTHYFFIFVFAALCAGLMLMPRRASRVKVLTAAVAVGVLVAPWFVQIPATLKHWRVTGYWLELLPGGFNFLRSALYLPWSYFSPRGDWGVRPRYEYAAGLLFAGIAIYAIIKLRKRLLQPSWLMLGGCAIAACVGLIVFDIWRGTYTVNCPRYAQAGYPAAILLAGAILGRLPVFVGRIALAAILLVSLLGPIRTYRNNNRVHDIVPAARIVGQSATSDDLVIVSSIPSCVAGIARSMESATGEPPVMASWVEQHKQRKVPDDLQRLARGRKRIFLVRLHEVAAEPQHEDWLLKNAELRKK